MMAAAAVAGGPTSEVERRIAERLVSFQGVLGVAAVHLDTGETIAVAADTRFPTASGIKTAVMVEVFQQVAAGKLALDRAVTLPEDAKVGGSGVLKELHAGSAPTVADLLFLMIAISDNTATNLLIGLVGTPAVNERWWRWACRNAALPPDFRGGHPEAFPDEEKEFGLGSSTPREMAALMEKIARGQAVSPEASRQMEALLGKQQVHELVCRLLPSDEGVTIAHKTGQDEEKLPDASGRARLRAHGRGHRHHAEGPYVVAIFARRVKDMRWTVDNDALVDRRLGSRAVYDHFTR